MSKEEILQFIAESREVAIQAAKNLQYIGPKRMNKALDIIEELLEGDDNE